MKILFAASECAPFAKVGGLADVVGSLPGALNSLGADARVILPKYKAIPSEMAEKMEYLGYIYVPLGWRRQYAGFFELIHNDTVYYFIDNEYYFGGEGIYGYAEGEAEKYAFFCKAVLMGLDLIKFTPDIIHANDWQTGMLPVLLREGELNRPEVKSVFTIHNLKYQGIYGIDLLKELLSLPDCMFTPDKLEFYGGASFIKGGLVYADKVTTVSPAYAQETLTPYYGERLDGVLRARGEDYVGILNGLDYNIYSPENDSYIPFAFSASALSGKRKNKAELQRRLFLEEDENIPVIAVVSRLVEQKGIDLIRAMLNELLQTDNFQLAVLGTGEREYEDFFRSMADWYPGRVSANIMYDEGLARLLYAGSDLFLMPSKFEPCGLSQLIAMKYGSLPIVRETGGLKDTVQPYDEYKDKGFAFSFANYNAHDMAYTIRRAVNICREEKLKAKLMRRAMKKDYSWNKSAGLYMELYNSLKKERDS